MLSSQFNKSKSKSVKTKSMLLQQDQSLQKETDSNKEQSNSSFSFNFSIETQEQTQSYTSPFELQFCEYDADKDPQEKASSSTKRRRRRKKQKEQNSVIRRDVNSNLTGNIHKKVDHDESLSSDDSDDDNDIEAMASFVHSAQALISPSSKNTTNSSAAVSNHQSNDLYQLKELDKEKINEGEKLNNHIRESNPVLPANLSTDQKHTCKEQDKQEKSSSATKTDSSISSKPNIAFIGKSNTISDKSLTATDTNKPLKKRNTKVSESSATSSSTIPPPLANIPNRLLRKTPKKTKSNNTSTNIARQAQLQAIKEKQTKVSGPPPGFSPKAKGKNSQPVLQFNTSDKGKAMVNHGSIAVHKEKMKNQQHDKSSGNPKNDSQVIGSNAFSFGFNFGSLLEDV